MAKLPLPVYLYTEVRPFCLKPNGIAIPPSVVGTLSGINFRSNNKRAVKGIVCIKRTVFNIVLYLFGHYQYRDKQEQPHQNFFLHFIGPLEIHRTKRCPILQDLCGK